MRCPNESVNTYCLIYKLPSEPLDLMVTSTAPVITTGQPIQDGAGFLHFIEKESGAKIGMVSTGPERDQTISLPEFEAELDASRTTQKHARAK